MSCDNNDLNRVDSCQCFGCKSNDESFGNDYPNAIDSSENVIVEINQYMDIGIKNKDRNCIKDFCDSIYSKVPMNTELHMNVDAMKYIYARLADSQFAAMRLRDLLRECIEECTNSYYCQRDDSGCMNREDDSLSCYSLLSKSGDCSSANLDGTDGCNREYVVFCSCVV